ncbi:MAG: 2-keto-4-pentenoate hydratase, partial [Flavobacteriales bacterium]|nr:2-keto-4-pentenoate hydratase [Flavobacteriales bacterium]
IKDCEASTPFMTFGDRIEIEVKNDSGHSIFGKINQVVKQYKK